MTVTPNDQELDLTPPPGAHLVLPCLDLDQGIDWFADNGFRLVSLGPADDPRYAIVEPKPDTPGEQALRIRLDLDAAKGQDPRPRLDLPSDDSWPEPPTTLFPPGIVRAAAATSSPTEAPAISLAPKRGVIVGGVGHEEWVVGRAGLRYRDLLPDRWNGQFIASHIHVSTGGPVPDYVHYHHVDFQLIFVHRGWVRVLYQDQGEDFVLNPGDAILQAPGIRHRVLEASDDLYVVEISSPAEHETFVEHEIRLPNGLTPGRRYGGQDYVHFQHQSAQWAGHDHPAVSRCELGIEAATNGRYRVERWDIGQDASVSSLTLDHPGRVQINVVLDGTFNIEGSGGAHELPEGGCVTLGQGDSVAADVAPGSSMLRVTAN